MKSIKSSLSLAFLFALVSCSDADQEVIQNICLIDLPDLNKGCIKIYQPVCGCNDVTYSNSCFAEGIVVS